MIVRRCQRGKPVLSCVEGRANAEGFVGAAKDMTEWQIQEIQAAVQEADPAAPDEFVPHQEVQAWLQTWGTERERKAPQ